MKRLLFLAPMLAVLSAQAHPGHDPLSLGLGHFLQSPSHLLPAFGLSFVLFAGAALLKKRAERNLLRVVAAFVILAAIVS
jgi:hypothetical protein